MHCVGRSNELISEVTKQLSALREKIHYFNEVTDRTNMRNARVNLPTLTAMADEISARLKALKESMENWS